MNNILQIIFGTIVKALLLNWFNYILWHGVDLNWWQCLILAFVVELLCAFFRSYKTISSLGKYILVLPWVVILVFSVFAQVLAWMNIINLPIFK